MLSQNIQLGTIGTLTNVAGYGGGSQRFAQRNRGILRRQNQERAQRLKQLSQRLNEWMSKERDRRESTRSEQRQRLLDTIDKAQERYMGQIESIKEQQRSRPEGRGVYAGLRGFEKGNRP